MMNVFDVTDFGAVGNGEFDCTEAFQKAIDEAGEVKGAVTVPPGTYICSTLYMKPSVTLCGFSGWGYRETGGSVIKLRDADAKCLIDMSGAHGARLRDIQLLGNGAIGEEVHGIYVWWENQKSRLSDDPVREDNCLPESCQIGFREDSVTIESCYIKNFSGDAVHLERIWGFTVKDSMMVANAGHALYIKGWDGWVSNCIMHTNRGAGIYTDEVCAAVTITANRIEWNRKGGINLINSRLLNITGNYFDRSYGPAIKLIGERAECNDITMTGNIFNRDGRRTNINEPIGYDSTHLYFDNCRNLAISGNTFITGNDDFGDGGESPDYCIVYKKLVSCSISGNTFSGGFLKIALCDLGENAENNCICNNAGI